MKKPLLVYNFFVTLLLGISTFLSARSTEQFIFAALFIPLPLYFGNRLWKIALVRARKLRYRPKASFTSDAGNVVLQLVNENSSQDALEGQILSDGGKTITDSNRRLFLRLVASSGLGLLLMALFTKKAEAAFFGSVPGPGTVAIKDSSGNQIDPAEKQPTDGYEIAQLDDTSDVNYAYYGFVNKTGAWYIMQEDLVAAPGTYLYAAGASSFSTSWTGRAGLTYTTFDSAF